MAAETWNMTDPWRPHPDHPVLDEESAAVLEEALHSLTMLRSPTSEGDAGARLHALASLMAQGQAILADAVADARDQEGALRRLIEHRQQTESPTRPGPATDSPQQQGAAIAQPTT